MNTEENYCIVVCAPKHTRKHENMSVIDSHSITDQLTGSCACETAPARLNELMKLNMLGTFEWLVAHLKRTHFRQKCVSLLFSRMHIDHTTVTLHIM